MGWIEKRGKNSWRITATTQTAAGPQPVQMTLRMDPSIPEEIQRRDAKRELRNLEKRLEAESSLAYTVRTWSEEWIDKLLKPDCSPVTIANYKYLLDSRILPIIGDYELADLTPAILTDWLISIRSDKRKTTRKDPAKLSRDRREKEQKALLTDKQLAKPLSAKTALNYYGCVNTMLAAAVRMGHLEHNPMDRVQRPRQKKNHKARMDEQDAARLIQLVNDLPPEDRHYRVAVLLALLCGLRLGEVCALHYRDVDWERNIIHVNHALKYVPDIGGFVADPKTESGFRDVTLPDSMMVLLEETLTADAEVEQDLALEAEESGTKSRYHNSGYIIRSRYGARMNKDTPSKWFRRFADSHGYKGVTFHDLRHAHASILVAHNVDIAAIASRMGHSDATVTLSTYTHPFAAHDQQAAKIMDDLLKTSAAGTDPHSAGSQGNSQA